MAEESCCSRNKKSPEKRTKTSYRNALSFLIPCMSLQTTLSESIYKVHVFSQIAHLERLFAMNLSVTPLQSLLYSIYSYALHNSHLAALGLIVYGSSSSYTRSVYSEIFIPILTFFLANKTVRYRKHFALGLGSLRRHY